LNKPFKAMPLDKMIANKDAAYDLAEKAGVIIKPAGMRDAADKIRADLADFGYHPDLQPGATAVLKEIEKVAGDIWTGTGKNVSLKGLDTIRKMAGNAYIQGNKSNNSVVRKIIDRITELEGTANPDFVAGINTKVGQKAQKLAREYAHRVFKRETVDNLIKKGNQQADRNITDTRVKSVKSQIAKINDPFGSWGRGYNATEKAAAAKAARYTPAQRALHGASVLNPFGGGKLSAAGHLGAAGTFAATGNLPAIALQAVGAGVGAGLQKWGEALSKKSVQEFVDIVANGGVKPEVVKNALQRLTESKRNAITQALLRAGVPLAPNPAQSIAPAR
jgi:hypothetical protein